MSLVARLDPRLLTEINMKWSINISPGVHGTGGSWFRKLFFLFFSYVIVLNMGGSELFTESKNLFLLLRYVASKLAPTRTFSGFCMGKSPKILSENNTLFETSPPVLNLEGCFFGYD